MLTKFLEKVKEDLADNFFCDNPNCSDVNEPIARLLRIVEVQRAALEFYSQNRGLFIDHRNNVFKSADCEDGVDFHGSLARLTNRQADAIAAGEGE